MTDRYARIREALEALDAAGGDVRMSPEMRSYIEGMSVSVDVSTGDHDAGHRYFGTVTEVMDCKGDKHGVTLLVQDAKPNFSQAPQAEPSDEEIEALAALKAENEMLRETLKDADKEMDWLDEDMDTCDHSVGVCMCSYWSMRRKMKAALERMR